MSNDDKPKIALDFWSTVALLRKWREAWPELDAYLGADGKTVGALGEARKLERLPDQYERVKRALTKLSSEHQAAKVAKFNLSVPGLGPPPAFTGQLSVPDEFLKESEAERRQEDEAEQAGYYWPGGEPDLQLSGAAVKVKNEPAKKPTTLGEWYALHRQHGRPWKDVVIGENHIHKCACGERAFVIDVALRAHPNDPPLAAIKSG